MALFSPHSETNHLKDGPRWVKPETVVDSGAAESVAPVGMAPWVPRQELEGSNRLTQGQAAKTWARKNFTWSLLKDTGPRPTFQVAEATKPLCSVSATQENRVVFELGGRYVEHIKSGTRTNFTRLNNVYVMNMYVQDWRSSRGNGFWSGGEMSTDSRGWHELVRPKGSRGDTGVLCPVGELEGAQLERHERDEEAGGQEEEEAQEPMRRKPLGSHRGGSTSSSSVTSSVR